VDAFFAADAGALATLGGQDVGVAGEQAPQGLAANPDRPAENFAAGKQRACVRTSG
jgi:hypothetical protein